VLLRTELSADLVLKQEALNRSLETLSLDELHALQAWDSTSRQQTEEQVASLQRALLSSETILGERRDELNKLQGKEPKLVHSDPNSPPVQERLSQLRTRVIELQLQLQLQQNLGTKKKSLINDITKHQEENKRWAVLSSLIGSASGDTFRQFAQGLTLESLVAHANRHLKELAPRYLLARVPGEDLELQIVDQHLAGDVRSVNSLSGGETFLTSLALALGLASLSASQTPVRTLFIDEGFGSLDRKSLDTALATLDALQAGGRQVGIISHVAGIADHIGVQVRVKSIAPGRSQVLLP
jgi:exonuclease SbcC